MSRVKILFGTYFVTSTSKETNHQVFDILKAHNVKDLDTAYGYVSLAPLSVFTSDMTYRSTLPCPSLTMCINRKGLRRL